MTSTDTKRLTRTVKIAMLEALRDGELNAEQERIIGDFVGREPVEIRFAGARDELEATINEVPDINL